MPSEQPDRHQHAYSTLDKAADFTGKRLAVTRLRRAFDEQFDMRPLLHM